MNSCRATLSTSAGEIKDPETIAFANILPVSIKLPCIVVVLPLAKSDCITPPLILSK